MAFLERVDPTSLGPALQEGTNGGSLPKKGKYSCDDQLLIR